MENPRERLMADYDFASLEAEHRLTPDRDLMLMTLQRTNETLAQIQRINGTVAAVMARQAATEPIVFANQKAIHEAQVVARTLRGVVIALGSTNLAALVFGMIFLIARI